MASYREVLKKAQVKMEAADRGEQAAFLYLLELTNKEAHNLYMEYDEEMPQAQIDEFEAGSGTLGRGRTTWSCTGL